ncbi:MAG: helix-turn-helix domain-containing protein [Fuerstiella sp.]
MPNETNPITLALSKNDLARELRTSERNIDRLVKSGELPKPFKLGGQVRWLRASIETALQEKLQS